MKAPDIDLKALKKFKEENFRQRLEFIDMYVEWLKKTPNKIWSHQQAEFIDSLILNGQNYSLSVNQYLKMVDIGKQVKNKRLENRQNL
jgi:hypothetical protein